MGKFAKLLQKNIKIRMAEKCLTQDSLSSLTGLTQSAISRILVKDGNCTVNTIEKIAKALSVHPAKLLSDGKEDNYSPDELWLKMQKHLKK